MNRKGNERTHFVTLSTTKSYIDGQGNKAGPLRDLGTVMNYTGIWPWSNVQSERIYSCRDVKAFR